MYTKILGFAPDLSPETPGILTDCEGFVPSIRGMKSVKSGANVGLGSLSSTAVGLVSLQQLDETKLTFAGTTTKLYKATTTGWTDVTRVSASSTAVAYTVPAGDYWTFAQYGDITLAAQKGDRLQVYSGTRFADLTQTVSGKIVEVVNDQIFLCNTAENVDRWKCSALGDYTDWVPNIATQAATNRLTDTYGAIENAKKFGDDIVIYKERSMYRGRYIGPPFIWAFSLISDEIGAVGTHGVVTIGEPVTLHLFVGYRDFYMYDGQRPRSIGVANEGSIISEWFFDNLNNEFREKIVGVHDSKDWVVYWFFPDNSSTGELNKWVAYNYKSGRWGKGTLTVEMATEYLPPDITYDEVGSLYTTYSDLPDVPYDSAFVGSGKTVIAYVDENKTLRTLNGMSGTNNYTTGDFGTDGMMHKVSRVRPRLNTPLVSATQTLLYKDSLGATDQTAGTSVMFDGAFDRVHEARWHKAKHVYNGDVEIVGLDVEAEPTSLE